MTHDTAQRVRDYVLDASRQLDSSVAAVREAEPNEEFVRYRDAVSRSMMVLLVDILNPMFVEHPDLKPKDWP